MGEDQLAEEVAAGHGAVSVGGLFQGECASYYATETSCVDHLHHLAEGATWAAHRCP